MKKLFSAMVAVFLAATFLLAQSPTNLKLDPQATATVTKDFVDQNGDRHTLTFDNWVTVEAKHSNGETYFKKKVHNLITDAGFSYIASQISGTATTASCSYIAVSSSLSSPAAGDTTLTGEISANGLSRAAGTFAYTAGTKSYTLVKQFTASGTQASQGTGVFTAASNGTLCFEATYGAVTVNNTDTLTVTWTVTESGT